MTKEILIVGVGSFAGGALRYILSVGLSKLGRLWAFPIGIMLINILGCFMEYIAKGGVINLFGVISTILS